ncbi:MAG: putative signal transducing protein [Solirubrobacteraceae bacterium]|jgi:hypothetical protein
MSENLEIVTSVSSEPEAEMIRSLLAEAGIQAILQRSTGSGPWRGGYGGCDVYVEAHDLDRAREVLKADEGSVSDEELTRLSEEAGREAGEP